AIFFLIPHTLYGAKAHTDSTWQGLRLTQIPQISLILPLMMSNLTEVDGMVVGHVLGSHRFNNKNNLC
ncbi:MAG: hypothetical protein SPJ46_06485, partial [Sodaliphilus sp.]|nr:hypothetical protein [Sodaliphilus sp.]